MIVEIHLPAGDAQARLVDPGDFTSFKVVLYGAGPPLAEKLGSIGVARVDEHVWVRVEALRRLAGKAATPDWEASLASMLEFARSRGWVDDETDSVRAHVEREPGSV
jgi:hypothetical protein